MAVIDLAADFAPEIDFNGDMTATLAMVGDLIATVGLRASLTADTVFEGSIPCRVNFAASGLVVGPLWADTAPPAPVAWKPSELCNG